MNIRDQQGEVHPYILAASITWVLLFAFLALSEVVMINAATYYATQAVKASLRGAARMQDWQTDGSILKGLAAQRFADLMASNLNLESLGWNGDTLRLQPNGAHPYIAGTATAEFGVLPTTPLQAVVSRVSIPLRLPFIGPYYRQISGSQPAICLSLAVTPHDQLGGRDLDPASIPPDYRCH